MLSGLFFLGAAGAIAAVIVWSILNDGVGTFGKTSGLFAMRDGSESKDPSHAKPTNRDGKSRRRSRRPARRDRDD